MSTQDLQNVLDKLAHNETLADDLLEYMKMLALQHASDDDAQILEGIFQRNSAHEFLKYLELKVPDIHTKVSMYIQNYDS